MTYLNHKMCARWRSIKTLSVFPHCPARSNIIYVLRCSVQRKLWNVLSQNFPAIFAQHLYLANTVLLHGVLHASFLYFLPWSILGRDDHNFSGNCYRSGFSLDIIITWRAVPSCSVQRPIVIERAQTAMTDMLSAQGFRVLRVFKCKL